MTAASFSPRSWIWFAAGNIAVAATYAMIGVVVGAFVGRLGGLYLMFLFPLVDVGIAQNVMFCAAPPDWGVVLPARGAVQVLIYGAFTPTFDAASGAALGGVWMVALAAARLVVFRNVARPGGS